MTSYTYIIKINIKKEMELVIKMQKDNEYYLYRNIYDTIILCNSDEQMFKEFKEYVIHNITVINKIINTDMDKMTDEEFWKFINIVLDIDFKDKDYLKMVSLMKGKKFDHFDEIWSTMTFKSTKSEGHGHDFSWWEAEFQRGFKCVVSEKLEIDSSKPYTVSEIKKMIASNDLVLIADLEEDLEFTEPKFKREKIQDFPLLSLYISINSELFPYAVQIARKKVTKKKVLKVMAKVVEDLQEDIELLLNFNFSYKSQCEDWYENSGMKLLLQRVTENKK